MTPPLKPTQVPVLLMVLSTSMAACSQLPLLHTDNHRGETVRKVWAAQATHPQAPRQSRPPPLSSGMIAKASMDRLQKSFESPPAPVNVLNIGVGTSSSHGSGR